MSCVLKYLVEDVHKHTYFILYVEFMTIIIIKF
jgi:hypothetical protein